MEEKEKSAKSAGVRERCKRNWENLKNKIGGASELFYQFIFTYGTMTVIVALSICIFLLDPYAIADESVTSEIWSIIINSYMPTTITFVGVLLFSDNFFSQHKSRGVVLELLVVSMGLAYIAFVSINDINIESTLQLIILEIIRYINVLLMIPSIMLMPGFFVEPQLNSGSDGRISH